MLFHIVKIFSRADEIHVCAVCLSEQVSFPAHCSAVSRAWCTLSCSRNRARCFTRLLSWLSWAVHLSPGRLPLSSPANTNTGHFSCQLVPYSPQFSYCFSSSTRSCPSSIARACCCRSTATALTAVLIPLFRLRTNSRAQEPAC